MSRLQRDMSHKKRDTPLISTSYESIRVIDDWLNPEGAEAVLQLGLASDYVDMEWGGHVYPSTAMCSDDMAETMRGPLSAAVGGEVEIVNTFFRLSHEDLHMGDIYTNAEVEPHEFRVHWDPGMGPFTAILYLNRPPYDVGGTAYWRHVPSSRTSVKGLKKGTPTYEQLFRDCTDGMAWELHSLVGSQWNRLAIYRSDLIHSQWPLAGWGSTKETSRLVWVCFFTMPQ